MDCCPGPDRRQGCRCLLPAGFRDSRGNQGCPQCGLVVQRGCIDGNRVRQNAGLPCANPRSGERGHVSNLSVSLVNYSTSSPLKVRYPSMEVAMSLTLTNIPRIMTVQGWTRGAALLGKWFNRAATRYPHYTAADTTTITM